MPRLAERMAKWRAAQQGAPGRAGSLRAPLVALPPAVLGQPPGRLEAHRRLEAVHVQRPVRVAGARVDLGLGGVHRLRGTGRPAQPGPNAPRALALPPAPAAAGLAGRAGCCADRAGRDLRCCCGCQRPRAPATLGALGALSSQQTGAKDDSARGKAAGASRTAQAATALTDAPAGAPQSARAASARTAPLHAPYTGACLLVHDRRHAQARARTAAKCQQQGHMRRARWERACWYTTAGGYSGAQDSESSRKRWLRGSASAAAIMFFTACARAACIVSRPYKGRVMAPMAHGAMAPWPTAPRLRRSGCMSQSMPAACHSPWLHDFGALAAWRRRAEPPPIVTRTARCESSAAAGGCAAC